MKICLLTLSASYLICFPVFSVKPFDVGGCISAYCFCRPCSCGGDACGITQMVGGLHLLMHTGSIFRVVFLFRKAVTIESEKESCNRQQMLL